MIRKLATLLAMVVAFAGTFALVHPATTYAVDPFQAACTQSGGSGTGTATVCKSKSSTNPLVGKGGILNNVANILATVGGIIVVIMIIVGGIKYVTSSGDSAQAASAKNTIIYGLIGLIVIILARSIVGFVLTRV